MFDARIDKITLEIANLDLLQTNCLMGMLGTNLRGQLDEAFTRRFQSTTLFRMPNVEQGLRLWQGNFADKPYRLADDIDLHRLAREYELSGGSIIDVLRYACLQAVVRDPPVIEAQDLLYGVKKEMHKDGKFLSRALPCGRRPAG
ncbi:hypothetical protein [Tardiphaga sp.]|uniref:hypothetical protein n=1 Tax=Tardiphaga sp. TaxID=1926292 RepID=UPI00260514CB|nr:hypothetical protein [Tardiphaga sp.]MDB5617902.1 hypothetical protein [Tardiphaga sp.]